MPPEWPRTLPDELAAMRVSPCSDVALVQALPWADPSAMLQNSWPGATAVRNPAAYARSYSRELRLNLGGSLDDQLFCSMAKVIPFAMYVSAQIVYMAKNMTFAMLQQRVLCLNQQISSQILSSLLLVHNQWLTVRYCDS